MDLASLIPQLLTQGGQSPGGPQQVMPPLPLVPPGAPLPNDVPNAANIPSAGLMTSGNFPQPTMPGSSGGGPAPTLPPGGNGSAPDTNAPGQGMPGPPGGAPMPHPQYLTVTQQDGSVLMFMKNPDGTRGPAVKIISPPKRGLNRAAEMAQVK